ncbi:MAG: LysM peptidoglycan-binding domain-containing protein [Deltaproteobacteria bacterium]|nr:LysM peptidoglycan-binding domain-containing protein [Deltaproteobacteria bacterium]
MGRDARGRRLRHDGQLHPQAASPSRRRRSSRRRLDRSVFRRQDVRPDHGGGLFRVRRWRFAVRRLSAICLPIPALLFAAGCQLAAAPSPLREGPPVLRVLQVKYGNTLSGIAARYRIPGGVQAIVELNGLDDPDYLVTHRGLLLPDGPGTRELPVHRPSRPAGDTFRACASARHWTAPAREDIPSCMRGSCTHLGVRAVCLCGVPDDVDREDDEIAAGLHLSETGSVWRFLPVDPWMGGDDLFAVTDADLDGDGRVETVVAVTEAMTNGMGVTTSRVAVFRSFDDPPMRFNADDWGSDAIVEATGRAGCDLLVSEWPPDLDHPLDGPGTYFAGRRWRYGDGEIRPAGPPVIRRYRSGFEDERLGDWADWSPAKWLSSAEAENWPTDPSVPSADGAPRMGRIAEVRLSDRNRRWAAPTLMVLADGHAEPDPFQLWGLAGGGGPPSPNTRLGDAGTGAVFPSDYVPADPVAAWTGRSVRIEDWAEPWRNARTVWLGSPREGGAEER